MFDTSSHCTAIYVALISMLAFMYVRLRRVETQLAMTNATIDVLMGEDPPSEFLPVIGRRLDEIEHRIQCCANALVPTPSSYPKRGTTRSVSELRDTDSDSNAESESDAESVAESATSETIERVNQRSEMDDLLADDSGSDSEVSEPETASSDDNPEENDSASPEGALLESVVDDGPVYGPLTQEVTVQNSGSVAPRRRRTRRVAVNTEEDFDSGPRTVSTRSSRRRKN